MIEFDVKHIDLINREPELQDLLREEEVDYTDKIKYAGRLVRLDFKTDRFKERRLGTSLSLQSSVTKAAAFTGAISNEDFAERMKFVIQVTNGSGVFVLQGTNDGGTNYFDVANLQCPEVGRFVVYIDQVYKKYRLKKLDTTSTTYSAYLTDDVYDELLVLRSLILIFESYVNSGDNRWIDKRDEYKNDYNSLLMNGYFPSDDSDDGSIDDDEAKTSQTSNFSWSL